MHEERHKREANMCHDDNRKYLAEDEAGIVTALVLGKGRTAKQSRTNLAYDGLYYARR